MRQRWLGVFVFLIALLGIIPVLPVAAQSTCTISTRSGNVRMRADHSTTAALVGNMPKNVQLQVTERFLEPVGKKTRIWYHLVKAEAAPNSDAADVWVGGTVKTKGDCVNIGVVAAPAAPVTDAGSAPAAPASGALLPQSGTWTLTYGNTVNITCDGIGSADFPTTDEFSQTVFSIDIVSAAGSFSVDGVGYQQDSNGTWHGYYSEPAIQATGSAYMRVDSPTSILGDIIITAADIPGCTGKFPFWASPS